MSEQAYSKYSGKITYEVNNAPQDLVGVQLGKLCITKNIPVVDVAQYLNVSRQTVYFWFKGKCRPKKELHEKIEQLVEKLSQQ